VYFRFYYPPQIQHRVIENQAPINRLAFEVKDDFGDFGSESTVTGVVLKYPNGGNVTLGDLTYEPFFYYRGNFNPDNSCWSYDDTPLLYKYFYAIIESPLVIGAYTIEVTMENGQKLTTTINFDFLLDLPIISSRTFQIQTDSSGNVHWTWQIPEKLFALAESYDLIVKPAISAYSGGKFVAMYFPNLPVEVGYAITPSNIFQELVNQADEIQFGCQVRTTNSYLRSSAKAIIITDPSYEVSIVPKKTAVVIPLN